MFNHIASRFQRLWTKFHDKAYRDAFVASHLKTTVAAQVAALREARGLTQKELADAAGTSQSQISLIESPNYDKMTFSTLKRLASALDVAVVVRFVPFSTLLRWANAADSEKFVVPSFEDDHPPEATSLEAGQGARDVRPQRRLASLDLPIPDTSMLAVLRSGQSAISFPVL